MTLILGSNMLPLGNVELSMKTMEPIQFLMENNMDLPMFDFEKPMDLPRF